MRSSMLRENQLKSITTNLYLTLTLSMFTYLFIACQVRIKAHLFRLLLRHFQFCTEIHILSREHHFQIFLAFRIISMRCEQNSPYGLIALTTILTRQETMAWGGLFLSLSRPSPEQQKSCLAAAGGFNYDTALHGASTPKSPATLTAEASDRALVDRGFSVNRSRILIGSGADTFLRAKSALLSWKHLALGWANVEPDTPVKAGTRFCICYKEVIPWVMFPLQIAYVTDGNGGSVAGRAKGGGVFAFGSGTLQGHLLAGEERFSVQLDDDEQVWYEVLSFSKPAHILSALCYPYVQLRQRHFARQSGKALLEHVAACSTSP